MSDTRPMWARIIRSIFWYLWLALGPRFKDLIINLDKKASNVAHEDPDNDLHNDH